MTARPADRIPAPTQVAGAGERFTWGRQNRAWGGNHNPLPSPDLAAARTGPNPAAIPANPQAPLWRPSGQDSPAPHRSGASWAAGFSYTAEQRPGTAERQKTHSGAISGGDCA